MPIISGMFGPVMSPSSRLDADRALPDAALAGCDGDDVLHARHELLGLARLRAANHGAPGDLDVADADAGEHRARIALDLVLERARWRRQLDRERDGVAVDDDRLDHVQGHDVATQLGFLDGAEGVEDGAFGDDGHALVGPRSDTGNVDIVPRRDERPRAPDRLAPSQGRNGQRPRAKPEGAGR
jgi:hypothetical protein